MARTAVNPRVITTPGPHGLELRKVRAADSATWKAGEMCFLDSGAPSPVVNSGKTDVWGIFAEAQATSTSSTDVYVYILVPGTVLRMFVSASGVAGTAASATRHSRYGVYGTGNVSYLDTDTANGQFEVIGVGSETDNYGDKRSDEDAAPGIVEVRFGFIS